MPEDKKAIVRFSYSSKKGFIDADKTKIVSQTKTIAALIAQGNKLKPKDGTLDRINIDLED